MIRSLIFVAALALAAFSFPQVTSGKASLMNATQIAKVRRSKYRILVPTYVPAGFRLVSCGMSDDRDPVLATWVANYKNPKTGADFTVQMASDGLGDPMFDLPNGDVVDPTGWVKASNPILGKISVGYYVKGKVRLANCTWYETKSKTYPKFAMILSHGMAVGEFKRVLESLRWLK